jgi:hypothetical protein
MKAPPTCDALRTAFGPESQYCGSSSANPGDSRWSGHVSKCLVDSTTTEDRTMLVKWLFTAASVHPAINSLSTVTAEDRDAGNRQRQRSGSKAR